MFDHASNMPDKRNYEKVLVLAWVWFTFIIITLYVGNLKAMIMSPRFLMPIQEPQDFLMQNEISWGMHPAYGSLDA